MTWKLRDTLACLVAPVIAATLGLAFGFLGVLAAVKSAGGSLTLENLSVVRSVGGTSAMYDLRPLGVIFVFSMATLGALGLVLRLTIYPHVPSRNRTLLLTVASGPLLVLVGAIVLVVTTSFLGADWLRAVRVVSRDPDHLKAWGGILLVVFVQGSSLGFLAGRWFTPIETPASPGRNWFPGIAGVIVVLSALIVPGAISWKRGSDRAACILNCRNVQQAMRSYSGMNGISANQRVPGFGAATLVGPGNFIGALPQCPAGGTYTWIEDRTPDVGELMIRCSHPDHLPPDHGDW